MAFLFALIVIPSILKKKKRFDFHFLFIFSKKFASLHSSLIDFITKSLPQNHLPNKI